MASENLQKKGEEMEVTLLTEKEIGGKELKFHGLVVETGLHIGASDDGMKIGGIDLPVIKRTIWAYLNKNNSKDPLNGELVLFFDLEKQEFYRKFTEPYIPGSSLKGKIRSLLEHFFGIVRTQVEVFKSPDFPKNDLTKNCKLGMPVDSGWLYAFEKSKISDQTKALTKLIIHAFGDSGSLKDKKDKKTSKEETPYLFSEYPEISRFIFRDCYISKDTRRMALEGQIELFEQKTENSIDRIKGTVNTVLGGLRISERVASGVRFDFQVGIRAFDETEQKLFSKLMELGLALLQLDGLGGSTSRGYGQLSFIVEEKEKSNGDEKWKLKKWNIDGKKIRKLREEIIKEAVKWAKK
ncbi:MAG: type III-A CRISPR-associated RAMP protein Csm3 [Campylobacterales bacterium]